jgi:predicted TIM-barrel fold metal-dependent hydrolase
MHIGTSGLPPLAPDAPYALGSAILAINTWSTVGSLLLSNILHRFPGLKFVMSEGGAGWIPAALERADDIWEIRPDWKDELVGTIPPSELFRRNIFATLLHEHIAVELRHHIGLDNIMFESDYPHADSKWPDSRAYASKLLADVPDEEAHRMIELNARRVFRFPRVEASQSQTGHTDA